MSAQASARNTAPAESVHSGADFALSGLIGVQLSEPLDTMQKVLDDIERTQQLSVQNMDMLAASVQLARKLAMQSQQIGRLASGRLRQSHETMQLDVLVETALRERAKAFRKRGIEVFHRIKPVEVIVDAGLLYSLVDAALDWAGGLGRRLTVTLELKNWPEHGMLVFKTSSVVANSHTRQDDENPSGDTVGWYLVNEICQAMGLSINRSTTAAETTLTIEFTRTVKRLEGLTTVEMETSAESMYGESRPMAGTRILVITDDVRLQTEIRSICQGTGLVVDSVSNAEQGVRFCEMQLPNLVIIDQHMRGEIFDELHSDLRKADPNFPFIEIAAIANTLEMAGWTSDSMSRLSRDVLATHLAETVVMDLAKVM